MVDSTQFIKCGECEKNNWLVFNRPEISEKDEITPYMDNVTKQAKVLARKLIKGGVLINDDADKKYYTQKALKKNSIIYDAYFENNVASTTIDILVLKNSKADIYLVKGTNNVYSFTKELSFQKMVLESNGIKVKNTFVLLINHDYIRRKKLNLNELFKKINVSNIHYSHSVKKSVSRLMQTKKLPEEPFCEIKKHCQRCSFFNYCTKDFPKDNIFNIAGLNFLSKLDYYNRGIISFKEFALNADETDSAYMKQVNCTLSNKPIVNKEKLRLFLKKLKYPLGFLDFETIAPIIPEFENTSSGEMVITQFSYHLIEKEGEKPKHFEFIGDGINYPEKDLCKELINAIKPEHTVLMYSSYEKNCIKHLIEKLPKHKKELTLIMNNLVDLETPFRYKYLYHPKMDGRSSLKKVLPALYPHSKKFGYDNLEVKNGTMAIDKYLELKDLSPKEREEERKNLLNYCCMDTLAMVALVDKIKEYSRSKGM